MDALSQLAPQVSLMAGLMCAHMLIVTLCPCGIFKRRVGQLGCALLGGGDLLLLIVSACRAFMISL